MIVKAKKVFGYSAIELLMVLTVLGIGLIFLIRYTDSITNGNKLTLAAHQAFNYSKALQQYVVAHQSILIQTLSGDNYRDGQVVAVSPELLKSEGFIRNNAFDKNAFGEYPCGVIFWHSNQLQAFLYYRNNGRNNFDFTKNQVNKALNSIGGMIGIYENSKVTGVAQDWGLDPAQTSIFFKSQGVALDNGTDPKLYRCQGSQIANNSFVINLASMLNLNNKLPIDDNVFQHNDDILQRDNPQSHNVMNDDLVMGNGSVISFKANPNCVMDPSRPETMQDYNPKTNPSGCRNRQLTLRTSVEKGSNQVVMSVSGFKQAGDIQNDPDWRTKSHPFVGELKTASVQPTTEISVGTACDPNDLGKMARQARDDKYKVNNLYVSQVQCMQSPMCVENVSKYCYLPVNAVTIKYMVTQFDAEKPTNVMCPDGMFVSSVDADSGAIVPKTCSGTNYIPWPVHYDCGVEGCNYKGRECSKVQPVSYYDPNHKGNFSLYQGITTTPTTWYQRCPGAHGGCKEDWGQVPNTYVIVRSVTCTSDSSKAIIPLQR